MNPSALILLLGGLAWATPALSQTAPTSTAKTPEQIVKDLCSDPQPPPACALNNLPDPAPGGGGINPQGMQQTYEHKLEMNNKNLLMN